MKTDSTRQRDTATAATTGGLVRSIVGMLVVAALIAGCGPGRPTDIGTSQSLVTAKPAATAPPRVDAIEAFVANVTSGTFSYRMAFDGHMAASADLGQLSGRMDVSGADFATTMTYDFSEDFDATFRVLARAVDGKAWQRNGTGKWVAIKGYSEEDSNAPFAAVVSNRDVKYLGAQEYKGTPVHRISIQNVVVIHPRTIPGLIEKEKIRSTTFEVLIDEEGRPVRGKWTFEGTGRVGGSGGQLQEVVFELTLAFSKVGAKLTIERP